MTDLTFTEQEADRNAALGRGPDLAELRRIAEALVKSRSEGEDSSIELLVTEADLNFIAAWRPEKALDLLTRLEAAEAAVNEYLPIETCDNFGIPYDCEGNGLDEYQWCVRCRAVKGLRGALAGGPR